MWQRTTCGNWFSPTTVWFLGLNSAHQCDSQVCSPMKSSYWPLPCVLTANHMLIKKTNPSLAGVAHTLTETDLYEFEASLVNRAGISWYC